MHIEKIKQKKNVYWFVYSPTCFNFTLFFNSKVFHQNYFCMRNNYDREILIQLEVFIRACRSCYVKKKPQSNSG